MKRSVLIAGIGGASLGTELFKSLRSSGNYHIFGADISPYAYGLYQDGFIRSSVVDGEHYVRNILNLCKQEKIHAVIPGGEEPLLLLYKEQEHFEREGILLVMNSQEVIDQCTDKIRTFDALRRQGIPVPMTRLVNHRDELCSLKYPCIIKPATGSGGSVFTYLAEDEEEAVVYIAYLKKRGINAMIQEYLPHQEGEYTVGILSLPNGDIVGSIALQRLFNAKLSYRMKYSDRVISSGYSQGLIADFKTIRMQAEQIARQMNSCGPLNIQGRLKDGIFYPFEMNARFSASTYLRTLAGFNEVDIFLQFLFEKTYQPPDHIQYGYYFRSLAETYVPCEEIKHVALAN